MQSAFIEFILLAVIGTICGGLAQFVVGQTRGGCMVSVGTGFIGAYLGPMVAARFGWETMYVLELGIVEIPLVHTAAGAFGLALLVGLLTRETYRR